jgi:hypothetical protein
MHDPPGKDWSALRARRINKLAAEPFAARFVTIRITTYSGCPVKLRIRLLRSPALIA